MTAWISVLLVSNNDTIQFLFFKKNCKTTKNIFAKALRHVAFYRLLRKLEVKKMRGKISQLPTQDNVNANISPP